MSTGRSRAHALDGTPRIMVLCDADERLVGRAFTDRARFPLEVRDEPGRPPVVVVRGRVGTRR